MNTFVEQLGSFFAEGLPELIGPIVILVVGWIVALALGAVVRAGLRRIQLDQRIARKILGERRAQHIDTGRWTGKLIYYVVLAFVALLFLQSLDLTAAAEPLGSFLNPIFEFIPRILGAAAILLVAWLTATAARGLVSIAMRKLDVDGRVQNQLREPGGPAPSGQTHEDVGKPVASVVYWLVLLLFTAPVLSALRLEGLLAPVQGMIARVLTFLPNIFGAGLILLIGWFVARVVARLVTNVLSSAGLDRLGERVGAAKVLGQMPPSKLAGVAVYALILLPVAVGALNALRLQAVTAPASLMLETFFAALPALFGAVLLLAIAYAAARLLAGVVRNLLHGLGFDNVLLRIGFSQAQLGERELSNLMGGLTVLVVMYFAAIEAAWMLGFGAIAALASDLAVLGGRILLGLVIFGVGLYLSHLAATAIRRSGVTQAPPLATTGRVAVLALSGAMALRQMGIANEIIALAFGLTLGAVAVAGAIAFGLGGREVASQIIAEIRQRPRSSVEPPTDDHPIAEE